MLQNRLHLQQVVQSSVPILSVLAFSALGPVKHTHTHTQTESEDNEASAIHNESTEVQKFSLCTEINEL